MNTLMIEVGTFQSFDKSERPQVLVMARDNYKETMLTFSSVSEARERLPNEKVLIDTVLDQEEFHGLSIASDDNDCELADAKAFITLVDCGLFVNGFSELHDASST